MGKASRGLYWPDLVTHSALLSNSLCKKLSKVACEGTWFRQ